REAVGRVVSAARFHNTSLATISSVAPSTSQGTTVSKTLSEAASSSVAPITLPAAAGNAIVPASFRLSPSSGLYAHAEAIAAGASAMVLVALAVTGLRPAAKAAGKETRE